MISLCYLGFLGLLYAKISLDTIGMRKKFKISLGHGTNNEIAGYTAAHANFQAYVPILFLLAYPLEQSTYLSPILVHTLWMAILAGRVLHYVGIRHADRPRFTFRIAGMQLTLWPMILLATVHIVRYAASWKTP